MSRGLCCILLAGSCCVRGAETFASLSKSAETARAANRPKEAIPLYRQALQAKPDWQQGYWALGTLLYEQSDYLGAKQALTTLTAKAPKSAEAWTLLGLTEFERREYGSASRDLRRGSDLGVARNRRLDTSGREHLITLLTRQGEFDEAAARLAKAIQTGGSEETYSVAAGLIALRKPLFPSEVPTDQQEVVALAGEAMYQGLARNAAKAQEAFASLVSRCPDTEYVHYLYGSFLLSSNPEQAVSELKVELDHYPKEEAARLQLIFEYLKRDDPGAALPLAETAVQQRPDSYKAHNALGRALVSSGQLDSGIRELEVSRSLEPTSPQTRIALATAYAKAGRKEDSARERAEFLRLRKAIDQQETVDTGTDGMPSSAPRAALH